MIDEDFHALREQAQALQDLMGHKGWEVLVDYANERMRPYKLEVLNGSIDSIEKYKYRSGWLQGVHAVLDFPKTVANAVENEHERRGALVAEESY